MNDSKPTSQTGEKFDIHHDVFINSTKKKIFDAISLPEHLNNWWTLKCSGRPEKGAEYNFYFGSEFDWLGKVSKCETNQAFHIKMTKSDADWNPTSFGFDLEEATGGVQLKFWHIGWPSCNHHFRRSSYCWAILLNGLKNYIEKGIIVPFEDRE
jgi:uncharacterized protein YndB with AHSA1/START domain